ncbi:MAG: Stk1 family PASTA domain-containing Ser/Thr kinase [Eubacteriales bacterium]|nr:Stk1 family PASTA domain-containing Ser/Thr kinase [Eubacteriales bacterium]
MMKGMIFAERYQLEDFIGQGGMSLVYRAVDIRTGHSVAVKILKSEYNSDKEFLERFQREAQAASMMNHHNIVNLLDVGVEGEYRYLVLEYVSGNTLKDIIRQKGRLSTPTAVQIGVRILSALQHAHDNGIIHRDIKPQNVLIHSDGHVKVADFGIARMTNAFTISKGDTVVGSVHYSSPEQATGSVVEATSDIYSTGVVMYEMLTGRVPFVGDTPVSVAMQHIKDAPPPITDFAPETPPAVVAVVMKALRKNPADRYQSAREMADALMKAKDGKLDPDSIQTAQPVFVQSEANVNLTQPLKQRSPDGSRAGSAQESGRTKPAHHHRHSTASIAVTGALTVAVLAVLVLGSIQIYNRITNSAVAPDVVGYTVDEGMAMARRIGLAWQQTDMNHDTIPAGTVISQLPEPDTEMRKGDSLLVTVSLGPSRSVMEDVIGMSYDAATALLKAQGVDIVIIRTASTEPVGKVLQQSPRGGASYTAGQSVELTISGGSTLVPDVTEMSPENAATILKENSLTTAEPVYVEVLDEKQIGKVLAQSPTAGTLAVIDAPVTLTVAVASKNYRGEIGLNIQAADHARKLRITLVENDVESEQYSATYPAGQSGSLIVPLSSALSGTLICRVYLDDEMVLEQAVTLE